MLTHARARLREQTCALAQKHMCMYPYLRTRAKEYVHMRTCIYAHVCVRACVCVRVCACVQTCACKMQIYYTFIMHISQYNLVLSFEFVLPKPIDNKHSHRVLPPGHWRLKLKICRLFHANMCNFDAEIKSYKDGKTI